MKRGIHLKKKRFSVVTKEGSSVIYNIVQVVKKSSRNEKRLETSSQM